MAKFGDLAHIHICNTMVRSLLHISIGRGHGAEAKEIYFWPFENNPCISPCRYYIITIIITIIIIRHLNKGGIDEMRVWVRVDTKGSAAEMLSLL
jgi:hypothetical protein